MCDAVKTISFSHMTCLLKTRRILVVIMNFITSVSPNEWNYNDVYISIKRKMSISFNLYGQMRLKSKL